MQVLPCATEKFNLALPMFLSSEKEVLQQMWHWMNRAQILTEVRNEGNQAVIVQIYLSIQDNDFIRNLKLSKKQSQMLGS